MKKNIFFIILLITFSLIFSLISYTDVNEKNDNTIKIGFDPNLPPYQFYEDGEYKGFNIDLMNKIAEENNLKIELLPIPLYECYEKFKNNEIDIIMGIRYAKELEDIMEVSDSLVQSKISMVMPIEGYDELRNKLNEKPLLIAVENNSVEYDFVYNIKKANFNVTYNQASVIDLLRLGRADMMIGVRHVVEYILDKYKLTDSYIISDTYTLPVNYYLGINKLDIELINTINAELKELRIKGEYEEIYNKWINDKNIENQKKIQKILTISFIIAVIFIIAIEIINLQLRQLVAEKTNELSISNKQLENKIREIRTTNELKNLVCQSSPRSIVTFDIDGKVTMMNESSLKMCQIKEPLIGETIYCINPINFMIKNYVDRVLKQGEHFMGKEVEYKALDKKWIYRFTMYPLNDYDKKIVGAIVTIEDVTEEKALRAQIEENEKNRVLTHIISGIAHEIRNPLTSIKAYVELLQRKKDNLEFQKQISTVVPHEVERVDRLIEQLIDYTKPHTQNIKTVEVEDLIESIIILFKPTVNKKKIILNSYVNGTLLIKVDKDQIKQVIINLLLNAIDAVDEMRQENINNINVYEINIRAFSFDDNVVLSIEDNGIGMTEEELKNAYELFYTTKVKGTGLGLSLSKQIINENGGDISIESKKFYGTKISITFKGDTNEGKSLNNR